MADEARLQCLEVVVDMSIVLGSHVLVCSGCTNAENHHGASKVVGLEIMHTGDIFVVGT
jgi:hypothetical protein